MASVQMVSRCCTTEQKANRWHGMSQYQTPIAMPTHLADTATTARAVAADHAGRLVLAKYRQLANSHIFVPVAIETRDRTWILEQPSSGIGAGAGPTKKSRHIEDTRETTFQRLSAVSVALQRENAVPSSPLESWSEQWLLTVLSFNTEKCKVMKLGAVEWPVVHCFTLIKCHTNKD